MLGSSQDVASQVMQRLPLKFRVQFPYPYPIPKLLQVIYNDQLVCTSAEGECFRSFEYLPIN